MVVAAETHRFTVTDYHRMAEAGIFHDDDRVELIEGEIVDMAPIGRRHQSCVDRLNRLSTRALGDSAVVRIQGPVRLSQGSEPQPDVALLRPQPDFYAARDAAPEDVLLLIEVADTTLAYDRDIKLPLYARSGIPEVWIVDLNGQSILVCREPGARGYGNIAEIRGAEPISPQALPDFRLTADRILS